jgi:hypothetical protein
VEQVQIPQVLISWGIVQHQVRGTTSLDQNKKTHDRDVDDISDSLKKKVKISVNLTLNQDKEDYSLKKWCKDMEKKVPVIKEHAINLTEEGNVIKVIQDTDSLGIVRVTYDMPKSGGLEKGIKNRDNNLHQYQRLTLQKEPQRLLGELEKSPNLTV